jgi:DEAD/DEAH box helicase domain-containing protein
MHTTACWFLLPTGIVWEGWSEDRRSSALTGLAHLLKGTAPLFLMCDRHDLRIHSMVRDPFLGGPAVYLADNYPGGVGLAEAAYGLRETLLESAAEALEGCPCEEGCPACVGALGSQMHSKRDTRFLLDTLLDKSREPSSKDRKTKRNDG